MDENEYCELIIHMLRGETSALRDVADRLDWQGVSAVLHLYDATAGPDRENVIHAMGHVLDTAEEHPSEAAQVLLLINTLGLTQVEPHVEALRERAIASEHEALGREITNYFAFKEVRQHRYTGDALLPTV